MRADSADSLTPVVNVYCAPKIGTSVKVIVCAGHLRRARQSRTPPKTPESSDTGADLLVFLLRWINSDLLESELLFGKY